ncbi:MAG: urease accessory protein UreD [Gammaproteobacteria bacterium]|nr:urease accessory protein UreD [Gammaproteobacteria bacterium]
MNAPAPGFEPKLQRTHGSGLIRVRHKEGRTRLADLRQEGALRLRLPRVPMGTPLETVLINTAGGLTGGDTLGLNVELAENSELWVTSQACEKVYRSLDEYAVQTVRVEVGAAARLVWLPQPAILFQDSAYHRVLEVDLDGDGELFAIEASVLGRAAMGERITRCRIAESWRIRRQGRLQWASEFALDDPAALTATAALGGLRAFATFVHAAPSAAQQLAPLREIVGAWRGVAGVSALADDVVVGLLLAADADALMEDLRRLVEGHFGRPMPRVWTC